MVAVSGDYHKFNNTREILIVFTPVGSSGCDIVRHIPKEHFVLCEIEKVPRRPNFEKTTRHERN